MNKLFSTLLLATGFGVSFSQGYWQQAISYEMEIDMDVDKNQFHGVSHIEYENNSRDTLSKMFVHLYYNAFQPGSMMDVRSRNIMDPDPRVEDRISKLNPDEIGYHKIQSVKQKGKDAQFSVEGTIMEIVLNQPILPGKKTVLDLEFDSQVPIQIRRTGRDNAEGIRYSMTQWYPKVCEYDIDGWASNPYIGREFHGVWGEFDVKISIEKSYVLGGTGLIQNPEEVGCGYENGKPVKPVQGNKKTWHFHADKVHDFAWAADPDFIHRTAEVSNGTILHFIYQKDSLEENWEKLRPAAVECFEYMNKNFGEYPYKQYSVIQGGDGGMEYPMCTLITAAGSYAGLVSVTVHESIHSWYQGLLATNEAKYEWMDEGFCSFAQYRTLDHLYNRKRINALSRQYAGYIRVATSGKAEPLTTHADFYKLNGVYGSNAYSKGSVLVQQLAVVIGEEALMRGMKRYYYEWRFKHPTPRDFKRVMEKESGLELDWYFEQFVETINTVDYGVKGVSKVGNGTKISLERIGDMPMPLDVVVTSKSGEKTWYHIPLRIMRGEKVNDIYEIPRVNLEDWPWVYENYSFEVKLSPDQIESIVIDPSTRLADVDRTNNEFPVESADYGIYFKGN